MNSAKKMFRCCASLLLGVCALFTCSVAYAKTNKDLTDSLRRELAKIDNPADSIRLLYDVFDLSAYNERLANATELFYTARRANNEKVQLDALRHIANLGAIKYNDSIISKALELVDSIAPDESQRQTKLFIKICKFTAYPVRNKKTRVALTRRLLQSMAQIPEVKDQYNDVERLFELVFTMAGTTQGAMLSDCFDRLNYAIERLPRTDSPAMRNILYTHAAIAYWRNDQYQKSLDMDRRLLKAIDELQKEYAAVGRKYRSFHFNRYVAMRRMMRSYEFLTTAQVDSIDNCLRALAETDPDIYDDYYKSNTWSQAAVLIKHGKYVEALPLIKQQADNTNDLYERRYYLRRLREAALKAGNKAALLDVNEDYIKVLEEFADARNFENGRELSLINDVDSLRRAAYERESVSQRRNITLSWIAIVALLMLLVPLTVLSVRYRRKSRQLKRANADLSAEREELHNNREQLKAERDKARADVTRKSELIDYISHEVVAPLSTIVEYSQMIVDNVDHDAKSYLSRFGSVVQLNVGMLKEIMADVEEYVHMDNHKLRLHSSPVNVESFAREIVENVSPMLRNGVSMTLMPFADNAPQVVNIDRSRVGVVLVTMLTLVAKNTMQGHIYLRAEVAPDASKVTFRVCENGVCFVPGKTTSDCASASKTPGSPTDTGLYGNDLPVCSMLIKAMNGSLNICSCINSPRTNCFVLIIPAIKS